MQLEPKTSVSVAAVLELVTAGSADLSVLAKLSDRPSKSAMVDHLTLDSRDVGRGSLFYCQTKSSAPEFIRSALDKQAAVILTNHPAVLAEDFSSVTNTLLVYSPDAAKLMGVLLNQVFTNPTGALQLTAVTGTNGKTTIVSLLAQLFSLAGQKTAQAGTLGIKLSDHPERNNDCGLTTADLLTNYQLAADLAQLRYNNLVYEASSHALDQGRTAGFAPDVAVFTNLTRDHFDYHGNYKNYLAAKLRLFEQLNNSEKTTKAAVINIDDPAGADFCAAVDRQSVSLLTYGRSAAADLQLTPAASGEVGFRWQGTELVFDCALFGDFNRYNIAAVFLAFTALNPQYSQDLLLNHLSELKPAPGRLEAYHYNKTLILVDYAHTADALEKALTACRELLPTEQNSLWCVFGCGGDRDRGKRALMAASAEALSDQVVVTSDNPRTEDPQQIIADIMAGLKDQRRAKIVNADREAAIIAAIKVSTDGDVILIAGKGHEDYQDSGGVKSYFSDAAVVKNFIAQNTLKS